MSPPDWTRQDNIRRIRSTIRSHAPDIVALQVNKLSQVTFRPLDYVVTAPILIFSPRSAEVTQWTSVQIIYVRHNVISLSD